MARHKFKVLTLSYIDDRLRQPGEIVELDLRKPGENLERVDGTKFPADEMPEGPVEEGEPV